MEEADNILILGIRDLGVFVFSTPHIHVTFLSFQKHKKKRTLFLSSFSNSPIDEKIVSIKQLIAANPALVYQACVAYMKAIGL